MGNSVKRQPLPDPEAQNWPRKLGVRVLSLRVAQQLVASTNDYYVYIIWKTYTPRPVPFYVGKGHLGRLGKHLMPSESKINRLKTRTINKHLRAGIECGWSIVGLYPSEEEAFEMERALVGAIGRLDLGKGPLTNRTDGGDGARAHLAKRRSESASARRVVADGRAFGCLTDAAETLGITGGALSRRIHNGWPGYFYEDEGQRSAAKSILQRYRKAVVVEGHSFASASDASRDLGIDVRMISKRIALGWTGYYYTEVGQLSRRTIWGSRKDKVGVIVRWRAFATVAEASREIGESASMISKRAVSSNYPEYARVDGTNKVGRGAPTTPVGVRVGTSTYSSAGEAARHFGLTAGGVHYRCRSSNYPEWRYIEERRQEASGFEARFSSKEVSLRINGVEYKSQSEAARAHGVDLSTLKKRCRSSSFPSWVCPTIPKRVPKDGRPGLIGVLVDGRTFRSISAASTALGLPRAEVKARVESDDWPAYRRLP